MKGKSHKWARRWRKQKAYRERVKRWCKLEQLERKRMAAKVKELQQSVADCEATLAALEKKRANLVENNTKLPELRKDAAYLAHVMGDAAARKALDTVNAEATSYASELASIDDAVAAAKNRLLIAQAQQADIEDRRKAKEAMAVVAEFRRAGADLDAAFATIIRRGAELNGLVGKLHSAGITTPTWQQLDSLGFACMQTAIASSPWAKRFSPVAPSARRRFGELFGCWCQMAERRLKALLAEDEKEDAA